MIPRPGSPLARIAALSRPQAPRLAAAAVLGALAVGAGMGLLATAGYLISRAAQRPPILELSVAIVAVRFFGVSRAVFRYVERLAGHDAAFRALGTVRSRLFTRLEPLVPAGLPGLRTGDLLSRFVSDVDSLQDLWLRAAGPAAVAVTAGGLAAIAAAIVLPAAGLVLAAALVVSGIGLPAAGVVAARSRSRREAAARARLSAELLDALSGIPELVAYGASARAAAQIDACDRDLGGHRRRTALVAAASEGAMTTLAGLAVAGVLIAAVPAVAGGSLGGVMLALLALLALASFEAVRPLPAAAVNFAGLAEAAARVVEVTDRPAPVSDPHNPLPAPRSARLALRGVRARYGGGPWVIDRLDLDVAPGAVVAVTGPSGAGKTTLVHLLVRFRDPDAGAVLLDGRDLRDYAQADVRRTIGLAGQDAHLFPTSIRENLRIARPDATDADLAAALGAAHVWDWVESLPEGLGTVIGDGGRGVSGGQRQRLALARALLADVRLVVLDEPDAHLDDETARELVPELLRSARAAGVGVVLITHRADVLADVDQVVPLEGRAPAAAGG